MGKRILVGLLLPLVLAGCLASCGTAAIGESTPSAIPPEAIIVQGEFVTSSGATFAYELTLPASWMGRYEVEEASNWVAFDYSADPNHKETVFSLAAVTEAEWQEGRDEPGGGSVLLRMDGTVFVYHIALANMYVENEAEAEEFHAMVGQVQGILRTFKVTPVPR